MHRTIEELLSNISSREISEWLAYYNIEPFGDVRADMRAGKIVQAVILPWVKKGNKGPTLKECMLDLEVTEPMKTSEIKGFLLGLSATPKK